MKHSVTSSLLAALLAGPFAGTFGVVAAAQGPVPAPTPAPVPVRVEPVPQDPPKSDPRKQDPKGEPKQDPAKTQDPKPAPPKTDEPRIDRPEADQAMPKGTDPADIAAMRSAEQMLQAERRLAEELKAGKIAGLDKILPFDELDSWPYEDGLKGMPKRIKELSGKKVLMTGFMLPIDEVQNIKEFLLVKSLWSCCYGQPPDIHGIVRVVMPKGKRTDYFFDPLKIVGTFKVEATVLDGYCVDIYQLHVESLEALRFK
jgi:hypothetical protein